MLRLCLWLSLGGVLAFGQAPTRSKVSDIGPVHANGPSGGAVRKALAGEL